MEDDRSVPPDLWEGTYPHCDLRYHTKETWGGGGEGGGGERGREREREGGKERNRQKRDRETETEGEREYRGTERKGRRWREGEGEMRGEIRYPTHGAAIGQSISFHGYLQIPGGSAEDLVQWSSWDPAQ